MQTQAIINSVEEMERGIVKIIVLAINELKFSLGMKNTIKYLRGIQNPLFYEYEINKNITFGKLSHMKATDLNFIINMMIGCELLKTEQFPKYGEVFDIIKVTDEGLKYVDGSTQVSLTFIDCLASTEEITLNDKQMQLYDILRKIRNNLAQEKNIYPFQICSNSVLKGICIANPTTVNQFLSVKGIGQNFVDKYFKFFQPEILKFK